MHTLALLACLPTLGQENCTGMKKADRMEAYIGTLGADPGIAHHPCYQGYFTCFNEQEYYEAHDVLEHLWLRDRGPDHYFYKGLIQIAGAFVHLKKQFLRPDHPKDGRRLRPASRLFLLGRDNIAPYGPLHLDLNVAALCQLCEKTSAGLVADDFQKNPWHPENAPVLKLEVSRQ